MAEENLSFQAELGNHTSSHVNITTTAPSNPNFQLLDPRSLTSLNMSDLQALHLQRIRLELEEQARVDATISILLRRQQEEQQLIREASVRRILVQAFHTAPFSSVYSNVHFPGVLPYQPECDLLTQFPRPSQPQALENGLYLSDVFHNTNRSTSDWPISSSSETEQGDVSQLTGLASSEVASSGEELASATSGEGTGPVEITREEEKTPIVYGNAESRSIESTTSHFAQRREQEGKLKPSAGSNTTARKAVKRRRASPKKDESSSCSSSFFSEVKCRKQKTKDSSKQTSTTPKRDRRKYDSESFAVKLFRMCTDQEKLGQRDIVEFLDEGGGILLHDPQRMVSDLIPKYFRGRTFTSFRRQLVSYGFRKSQHSKEAASCGAYLNPLFCRGKPELCKQIMRDTRHDRARKVRDTNQDGDE